MKTKQQLLDIIEQIKTAKFCVPEHGSGIFVIDEDTHIELGEPDLLAAFCLLVGVEIDSCL